MENTERSMEELLGEHLSSLAEVKGPPRVTVEELVASSEKFPVAFPVQTARVSTLQKSGHDKDKLEEQINSAYPLIHEKVLPLLAAFLHHKRIHGRKKERKLYENLDVMGLVDRLVAKRPIVFFTERDSYILRDGTLGSGDWYDIGHSRERPGLTLSDYISYDEVKLSALLCVSSQSPFINDGSRHNRGVLGAPGTFQPEGVIVGMVGARLELPGVMEWQDCVVTPEQNSKKQGYGPDPPPRQGLMKEWGHFWGTVLPTWDQVQKASKDDFISLSPKRMLNINVYKARMQLSAETLLAEAGVRAKAVGLKAYVHVVGLGLGVWQLCSQQEQIFVDTFGDALKVVDTSSISDVDFSYINCTTCRESGDGEVFPDTGVTLHFSRRALHAPVPSGTLLVTNFAWDGNSLPGNEYWKGMLSSSGDPAAACSSGVAELHNSMINPRVCAANLHVASPIGIEHVADYARRKLHETHTATQ
ncbi:hypothetical protein Pmani_019882 [Petrolisthes manimaculis]|uniref:Uncharacterized protein n=1 Tax=Petrolisthes manimaculis TaxID=1843537 RepID=A0AAE1PI12_9EUCA|nr:hypothetical protein Pmani_019882 [Petrolisthes manimaculis]